MNPFFGFTPMQLCPMGMPINRFALSNGSNDPNNSFTTYGQVSMPRDFRSFNVECSESYSDGNGGRYERRMFSDRGRLNLECSESHTDNFGGIYERRMRLSDTSAPIPRQSQGYLFEQSDDSDSDSDTCSTMLPYNNGCNGPMRLNPTFSGICSGFNALRVSGQGNEIEVGSGIDAFSIEGENNVVRVRRDGSSSNDCSCYSPVYNMLGNCIMCGKRRSQGRSNAAQRRPRLTHVSGNNNRIIFE